MSADKETRLREQFERKFWQDTRTDLVAKRDQFGLPPEDFERLLHVMENLALNAWLYAAHHADEIHREALKQDGEDS